MPEPLIPPASTSQRHHPEWLINAMDLALTTPPAVHIPADFANRVAALAATQATPQPAVVLPPPRYARAALLLSTVAVLLLLLSLTPSLLARNPAQILTFTWLLSAEAVLLAAVFSPWRTLWQSPE